MIALSAVAVALEAKAQPYINAALGSRLPADTPLSLPAAYAGVVLVNVIAASFALISLGMAVGKARKKYGVEVRAALRRLRPGSSDRAQPCIAAHDVCRGHLQGRAGLQLRAARPPAGAWLAAPQLAPPSHSSEPRNRQALETFPSFLAVSLLGGLRHPYLVTLAGAAWIAGRLRWAALYAADGPAGRYGSVWSRFIWYGLVANAAAAVSFALGLAGVL